MNIIILGATGFVGRNVTEAILDAKLKCINISRSNGFDLREKEEVVRAFKQFKPDIIVNCAAHVGSLNYVTKQAGDIISDNARMIISLYEAIAIVCPSALVINPIANCAYPAKADTFIEDNWWDGHLHRSVLSYGASRRFLWTVSESYFMQYGIRTISLLVPNMYGPFDSTDPNKAHALNALISRFVKAKYNKQNEIILWGTGIAIREWLYAKDFGRIVVMIINKPTMLGLSEPVNIAQNFGLSVRELVELISEIFNFKGSIIWDTSMPDGAPKKVMDDRKFRKVFKDFCFTQFKEGINNTIKYYKSILPY